MHNNGRTFLNIIISLCVIALFIYSGIIIMQLFNETSWLQTKNNQLQEQLNSVDFDIQREETFTLLVEDWAKKDGYSSVKDWEKDIQKYKKEYSNCYQKFLKTDNVQYATENQKEQLEKIDNQIKNSRSAEEIKALAKDFDLILEEIEKKKNEEIHEEPIVTTEAYSYQTETIEENEYQNSTFNFDTSGSGLTKESGVNYYNGRTETYYSSNVLYHQNTSEWTVDEEGFYRTNDGYYVVAASDMEQGTTFEGSKGTCIVLDSGCDVGVTDYYVAF